MKPDVNIFIEMFCYNKLYKSGQLSLRSIKSSICLVIISVAFCDCGIINLKSQTKNVYSLDIQ